MGARENYCPASRSSAFGCVVFLAFIVATVPLAGFAWGGKTRIQRRYRVGQRMVYQTTIKSTASVHSNPEGLKDFLPPVPTEMGTRQQNTVTVRKVNADGTTQVENRFDRFEFESNLPDLLPASLGDSAVAAQEEFSERVQGQSLTVQYDRAGRLVDFEGADGLFEDLDEPLRETARQILRLFLEQMGGVGLYPDHAVKKGEEWKYDLHAQPTQDYPFFVEGTSTLRYVGRTRHVGTKAAIIDFRFTSHLRPSVDNMRQDEAWAQLEEQGMKLDIQIRGEGTGRVLVALDDGRLLQNHTTIQQTLTAETANPAAAHIPAHGPLSLRVVSRTLLQVEGGRERGR